MKIICLMLASAFLPLVGGCGADFLSGGGVGKKFNAGQNSQPNNKNSSGDSIGNDGPNMIMGPNGPYNPNDPTDPNNPFNNSSGNGDSPGLGSGLGNDQLIFGDAIAKVLRADKDSGLENHVGVISVQLTYKNKDSGKKLLVRKGSYLVLPGVCVKGGKAEFELTIFDGAQAIKPRNSPVALGPIGQRKSSNEIWVGYERHAAAHGELAYHNNDDFVFSISCEDSSFNMNIANLCLDDRIPGNDLVTDDITYSDDDGPNDGPPRLCNGH